MRYIFLLVLLAISLLFACQPVQDSQSDLTALKANFSVRYLGTERMLRGQALWYTEDTSLVVQADLFPGGVAFMGSGMQAVELPGNSLRYQTDMRVDYPDSCSFSFRLIDQSEQNNIYLDMPGVQDFAFDGPISLKDGASLQLQEAPLKADESLTLLFTDEQQQNRSIIVKGPSSRSTIKIEALSLANLSKGLQELYIVRSRSWQDNWEGMEVNKTVEFYSRTQEVEVVE